MYIQVDMATFIDEFKAMGREDNFSYEGLELLFEMLEDYEEAAGEDMVLDVISLCVEYSELSRDELLCQYSNLLEDPTDLDSDAETWDDVDDEALFEWLQEQSGDARMGTYSEYDKKNPGETFFVFQAF